MSFCALNFRSSRASAPKARTTRTPVRFSWAMAERSPSFSSHCVNWSRTRNMKKVEYPAISGTKASTARVSPTCIVAMKPSASAIISTTRTRL